MSGQELTDALKASLAEPEWVKCSDRMPELGQEVLACFKGQFSWMIFTAFGGHGVVTRGGYANASHWMPLPAPPEVTNA